MVRASRCPWLPRPMRSDGGRAGVDAQHRRDEPSRGSTAVLDLRSSVERVDRETNRMAAARHGRPLVNTARATRAQSGVAFTAGTTAAFAAASGSSPPVTLSRNREPCSSASHARKSCAGLATAAGSGCGTASGCRQLRAEPSSDVIGKRGPRVSGRRDPAPDTKGTDPLYEQSQRVPQILPWLLMVVVYGRVACPRPVSHPAVTAVPAPMLNCTKPRSTDDLGVGGPLAPPSTPRGCDGRQDDARTHSSLAAQPVTATIRHTSTRWKG